MSDSELKTAGMTLYNLSEEISETGFAQAVKDNKGVCSSKIYIIPLKTRPYCAVIEMEPARHKREPKYHKIGLGKYDLRIDLDGSVTCLPLEWEEGNSMRNELLNTVNSFIGYLSKNRERLTRVPEPHKVKQGGNNKTDSIDNSLLGIIDDHNFSEILASRSFDRYSKRRLRAFIDRRLDDGTLKEDKGRYKVVRFS